MTPLLSFHKISRVAKNDRQKNSVNCVESHFDLRRNLGLMAPLFSFHKISRVAKNDREKKLKDDGVQYRL
ncbi:MAG: hypothetical protein B6247_27140 [Candidatus Parabeggiatoa sp. nov. 2]|nr:MAG: hypothetical protein B6247_27140 [Beggiatoa sp. 4572_84]